MSLLSASSWYVYGMGDDVALAGETGNRAGWGRYQRDRSSTSWSHAPPVQTKLVTQGKLSYSVLLLNQIFAMYGR
jgi:hypothetical protein